MIFSGVLPILYSPNKNANQRKQQQQPDDDGSTRADPAHPRPRPQRPPRPRKLCLPPRPPSDNSPGAPPPRRHKFLDPWSPLDTVPVPAAARRPRPTAPVDGRRGPESCAFRRRRSRGPLPVPVRPEGTAFSPRGRRWPWSPSALVGRLVASRLSPLSVRVLVFLLCTQSQDRYLYYFLRSLTNKTHTHVNSQSQKPTHSSTGSPLLLKPWSGRGYRPNTIQGQGYTCS